MPEICDAVLWFSPDFCFRLEDFMNEASIDTLIKSLTYYLHKKYYGREDCYIFYDNEKILLIDKNFRTIDDIQELEKTIECLEDMYFKRCSYNENDQFRALVAEAKSKGISYKSIAVELGLNYSSFSKFRNNPELNIYSTEKIIQYNQKLKDILKGAMNNG